MDIPLSRQPDPDPPAAHFFKSRSLYFAIILSISLPDRSQKKNVKIPQRKKKEDEKSMGLDTLYR